MNKFVIVDIETANPDITSICQIAIVTYENGEITDQWHTLINPKTYFHEINVMIHGITERKVRNAPTSFRCGGYYQRKICG
ncbi:exonuclease domain-containing protein [Mannheimia granulomatis]|uniref:exonuclease domain-containing protein n=1 Tax=Mannheimia granulomatis TaxID=85402 RepID=UPI001404E4F3|nr:exonuclease domain-containing protein [Mannheimia granulomatis]